MRGRLQGLALASLVAALLAVAPQAVAAHYVLPPGAATSLQAVLDHIRTDGNCTPLHTFSEIEIAPQAAVLGPPGLTARIVLTYSARAPYFAIALDQAHLAADTLTAATACLQRHLTPAFADSPWQLPTTTARPSPVAAEPTDPAGSRRRTTALALAAGVWLITLVAAWRLLCKPL